MATKPKAQVTEVKPETAPEWQWPSNREKRLLEVQLQPTERLTIAEENARLGNEKDQLEDNKKAAVSRYKAQIEDVEARIRLNNTYVSTGKRDKEVPCEWVYEQAGFDSTGEPIEHPEKKTLVRLDTMEAVEVCDILESERQAALQLDLEEPEAGDAVPVTVSDDE
jgi:hypothetical protein